MKKYCTIFLVICFTQLALAERILVEDNGEWLGVDEKGTEEITTPAPAGNAFDFDNRMGVGFMVGGPLALGGIVIDLKFTPKWTISGGLGGSTEFTSFFFQAKRWFSRGSFVPYVSAGLARWHRGADNRFNYNGLSPGYVGDRLVSAKDKKAYRVSEFLLYPALGVQFAPFGGQLKASAIFAEVVLLADLEDFVIVPTGSAGWIYYF